MNGHVWAEFRLEGAGWVPVDPSIGQMIARQTGEVDKAAATFGHLRPIRFAFSTDLDLPLPEYGQRVHPVPLVAWLAARRNWGERPLLWGFETLDGAIPYVQPAYPRGARGLGLNALILPSAGYWATGERTLHWLAWTTWVAQAGWLVGALAIVLLAVSDWLPGPVQPIVTAVGGGLILLVSGVAAVIARPTVVQRLVQWRS